MLKKIHMVKNEHTQVMQNKVHKTIQGKNEHANFLFYFPDFAL